MRVRRINAYKRFSVYKELPRISTRCLKCEKKFVAVGRFNKICPVCNAENRNIWLEASVNPIATLNYSKGR